MRRTPERSFSKAKEARTAENDAFGNISMRCLYVIIIDASLGVCTNVPIDQLRKSVPTVCVSMRVMYQARYI